MREYTRGRVSGRSRYTGLVRSVEDVKCGRVQLRPGEGNSAAKLMGMSAVVWPVEPEKLESCFC